MKYCYRVCSIRGELRNPQHPGTESLVEAIEYAEKIVANGPIFPGLTVYDWVSGQKVATVCPGRTDIHEHV